MRVIRRPRRDVLPRHHAFALQLLAPHALLNDLARRRCVHEIRLDPRMPNAARVGGTPDHRPYAQRLVRAQTGLEEVIHHLREMRQLVDVQPMDLRALILEPVAVLLTVPEVDHRTVDQVQLLAALHIPPQCQRNGGPRLVDERVAQLVVGAPEHVRMGARIGHAPEKCVHDACLGFATARRATVQHLVGLARVKQLLSWGGNVVHANDLSGGTLFLSRHPASHPSAAPPRPAGPAARPLPLHAAPPSCRSSHSPSPRSS